MTDGYPIPYCTNAAAITHSETNLDVIEQRRLSTLDTNHGFKQGPGSMLSYGGLQWSR